MTSSYGQHNGSSVEKNKYWQYVVGICLFIFIFLFTSLSIVKAEENGILHGLVKDVSDKPVAGVEVSVYKSSNTRKPADYIGPTGSDGQFRITLPPGRYWVVARLRKGKEKFGPLLPGDKHSGAPLEIELLPGEDLEEEFIVADLEETSRLVVKYDTSFIRADGILMDKDGNPVEKAYAFANRHEGMKRIPDFVSTWTDSDGRYVLFLPPGTYYFGMAFAFPPGKDQKHYMKVTIDKDRKNINIVTDK